MKKASFSDLQVSLTQDMNYAQLVLDDINQSLGGAAISNKL